jgi:hypothetical protein
MWRMAGIDSVEVLEAWLTGHGLDTAHPEPGTDGEAAVLHPGYHVTECLVCHRPTIVGNGRSDVTCGRHTCDVPILGNANDDQNDDQ